MPQTPKRWSLKGVAFAASLTVVFAACGGTATSPSTSSAPRDRRPRRPRLGAAPSPSAAAFDGMTYPETGRGPCGVAPYTGNMKKITAIDALTVEFQLCNPDAAFLPKVAFSAFGIQDSDYLDRSTSPDGTILDTPNGTGPYKFKEWGKGNRIVWEANPDYWGDKAKTAEPRAPLERRVGRAPARPAVGHRRRHRQPGQPRTSPPSRPTRTSRSTRAPA